MACETNEVPQEVTAIDRWIDHVLHGEKDTAIPTLLGREVPPLLSWIVRGGCAIQCRHCIFPHEGPKTFGVQTGEEALLGILRQLSGSRHLIHEGRQLLPWQVPILAAAGRAGHGVSLINNGQYAAPNMLALCEREGLAIDALDVSVDGTKDIHNGQRASNNAWDIAMKGIVHAKHILKTDGKLTSLFTLTTLNHAHLAETGEMLTQVVDEWHVTTMSLRPGIEHLRAGDRELALALEQLLGGNFAKPVFLRTYSLDDFVALLGILGKETANRVLRNALVTYNAIVLDIGIPLYFYPKSLQVNETLVIDADGWWRLPFCIHHSLAELRAGEDEMGKDISHFNVVPVLPCVDVPTLHAKAASRWWVSIGRDCLSLERQALEAFL
ncbi:MAG: hypothetical protein WDN10_03695 [bacterium]